MIASIALLMPPEGMDSRHNPEFTNIELYQAYVDMNEMMVITENMFAYAAEKVLGSPFYLDNKKDPLGSFSYSSPSSQLSSSPSPRGFIVGKNRTSRMLD